MSVSLLYRVVCFAIHEDIITGVAPTVHVYDAVGCYTYESNHRLQKALAVYTCDKDATQS